jgi:hypothetical protein
MSLHPAGSGGGPPDVIYIIRHGEKPGEPPSAHGKHHVPGFGVNYQGSSNEHSLLPRGWQRSGALVALFAPASGPPRAGLRTPATLLSPSHGDPAKAAVRRTYQTIQGLADHLGLAIGTPFDVGHEPQLAANVVTGHSGVVLICWEHHHIPAIARSLPTTEDTVIPSAWPDDRYDVIWAFTLHPGAPKARYAFTQIPQRLLAGDTDEVIPASHRELAKLLD